MIITLEVCDVKMTLHSIPNILMEHSSVKED